MPEFANFPTPEGDSSREAVEALGGYTYQRQCQTKSA